MKRVILAAVIVLLGVTPVVAQSNHDGLVLDRKQPSTRGAAGGDGVPPQTMVGGVYMMIPDVGGSKSSFGPASALITFNADNCADSTPLWDGEIFADVPLNGAPHGTWGYEGAQRVVANLYYFTTTKAGIMDRFGQATLTADLDEDLATGKGQIVFKSFMPFQIPSVLDPANGEKPLGGTVTKQVRLIRMR